MVDGQPFFFVYAQPLALKWSEMTSKIVLTRERFITIIYLSSDFPQKKEEIFFLKSAK